MPQWYDEEMPGQDDGYERHYYPERFENEESITPIIEDVYDQMYANLREGKNADGSEYIIKERPQPEDIYKHHNGIPYVVLHIANQGSTNPDYPETVVYKGDNGKVWAKTMDNFLKKMTKV